VRELAGKRLQLLREIVPNLRRLAVLFDVGYSGSELQTRELETPAHKLGVEVEPARIRRSEGGIRRDRRPGDDTTRTAID
jgi:putative tryptophan/tyrosine transport system substrate-binding protein